MYNFFIKTRLIPKHENFQFFFTHNFNNRLSELLKLSQETGQTLVENMSKIKSNPKELNNSKFHAEYLDNAVNFQFMAIQIGLTFSDNHMKIKHFNEVISLANNRIEAINQRKTGTLFKSLSDGDQKALALNKENIATFSTKLDNAQKVIKDITDYNNFLKRMKVDFLINLSLPPVIPAVMDSIHIINFTLTLFTDLLNDKLCVGQTNSKMAIPDVINGIFKNTSHISSKTTLYNPQLFLKQQFKDNQLKLDTDKRFFHHITAYYLNLILIAATINDGRTHFLGLDRISWDAYLSSICIEIAEFFSIEKNQSVDASAITKEKASTFLKDMLYYPPLKEKEQEFKPSSVPMTHTASATSTLFHNVLMSPSPSSSSRSRASSVGSVGKEQEFKPSSVPMTHTSSATSPLFHNVLPHPSPSSSSSSRPSSTTSFDLVAASYSRPASPLMPIKNALQEMAVLYDYTSEDGSFSVSVEKDPQIVLIEKYDDGWALIKKADETEGYVPLSYLKDKATEAF